MKKNESDQIYLAAQKLGTKEYSKNISKGHSGYLPFLEGVLKNAEILYEIDLGRVELPLKKIVGTYTDSRSRSFASNFMPLLSLRSEFGTKWSNLCRAHIDEGIRDPIKVYEYLNWFYVVEGNKRVSVLKYYDAWSIAGTVSRLVPKRDENDDDISIYYEFLDFYKKTNINVIWFSRRNSFSQLLNHLEGFDPEQADFHNNKYKYFSNSVYLPFRKIYLELGGQRLQITTGDAFLEYIEVYGLPVEIDDDLVKARLNAFIPELELMAGNRTVHIQTMPADTSENLLSTLTTFVKPKKTFKVAFIYPKDVKASSWTYLQEMGRNHVDSVFGDTVETTFIDNVPETADAYDTLKVLAEGGNDIVFATSPAFINASLKAALEYPQTRFLNCSETHSYRNVNTYFGRIYEPRFLAGIAAGAVTKTNIIGYVATNPIPGVINGINAFALGARLANPDVRVKVEWVNGWDLHNNSEQASAALIADGADVISHHDTLSNREFTKEYGVYSVIREEGQEPTYEYIAAPVWNWGIFYEKMIRSLMNSTWKQFNAEHQVVNFWWGMDSGIVDFFYSKRLVPRETQKLLEFMKSMMINGSFYPFYGPIYSQDGTLQVKQDQPATREQIVGMDWFVDIIDSELPTVLKDG